MKGWRWLLLAVVVAGCGDSDPPASTDSDTTTSELAAVGSEVECDAGDEADYFVPGATPEFPALIIGCARLPETRERVEFSANGERFRGSLDTCINPAYEDGNYIPATCTSAQLARLEVFDSGRRRAASRPDGFVIWGTAPAGSSVSVVTPQGEEKAVTFAVSEKTADRVGASEAFSVFVAELPVDAACEEVSVETPKGDSIEVPGGRNVCPDTRDQA